MWVKVWPCNRLGLSCLCPTVTATPWPRKGFSGLCRWMDAFYILRFMHRFLRIMYILHSFPKLQQAMWHYGLLRRALLIVSLSLMQKPTVYIFVEIYLNIFKHPFPLLRKKSTITYKKVLLFLDYLQPSLSAQKQCWNSVILYPCEL